MLFVFKGKVKDLITKLDIILWELEWSNNET